MLRRGIATVQVGSGLARHGLSRGWFEYRVLMDDSVGHIPTSSWRDAGDLDNLATIQPVILCNRVGHLCNGGVFTWVETMSEHTPS